MCALAHVFERAGVATVIIGLIPQHVERMRPPRALLVPFPLGRPLGAPGDAGFQRAVLTAALGLAERVDVPVVAWFDEEVPVEAPESSEGWACPVSFPVPKAEAGGLLDVAVQEVAMLQPWYDRARRSRGSSAVGLCGLDQIEDVVRFLGGFLSAPLPDGQLPGLSRADAFKLAAEDLKQFYLESAAAQPGANAGRLADWFWRETSAGRLLFMLRETLVETGDPRLAVFARFTLVPETVLEGQ